MLDTLIAMGAACIVFFVFLLVFFRKDRRERATGIRAGCQQQHEEGRCGHCQGKVVPKPPAETGADSRFPAP